MRVICALLIVFMVVLALRAILSWFPPQQSGWFSQLASIVFEVTEPVLAPMRRIIPPAGMFDLSFLVVFLIASVLYSSLC
jgi:YggT family protein